VIPHNLLIAAQRQFTISAALSGAFSGLAGAGETEDFGTGGQPVRNFPVAHPGANDNF
jgi:ABC-type uncharacterized transport system permease subunit